MTPFVDLGGPQGIPEDQRIDVIGQTCMKSPGSKIGFLIEMEDVGKMDRYLDKLFQKFPRLTLDGRWKDTPTKGIELARVVYLPAKVN